MRLGLFLLLSLLFISCSKGPFKESVTFAGGKVVSADHLNLGQTTYMEYCVSCHGDKGDGKGISHKGLVPPPRDFTQGVYKFANVVSTELPHDEDFYRIIRHGLKGTAMLPWDIHDKRLDAVTQYIKTFAPQVWEDKDKTKVLGTKIEITPDPYANGDKTAAIQRGKEVYHVVAQCFSCHRAYVPKTELADYHLKINKSKLTEFDTEMYKVKALDSEFNAKVMPPDFTYNELRTVKSLEDIYWRIVYGVNGSGMPGWKGTLEDNDIWAVAYYVQDLIELKADTKKRQELLDKLANQ